MQTLLNKINLYISKFWFNIVCIASGILVCGIKVQGHLSQAGKPLELLPAFVFVFARKESSSEKKIYTKAILPLRNHWISQKRLLQMQWTKKTCPLIWCRPGHDHTSIPAECHAKGVIVMHACGSKTLMSRLLTPVFQFLTPGRNIRAITILTDTFWKIYYYVETLCGKQIGSHCSFDDETKSTILKPCWINFNTAADMTIDIILFQQTVLLQPSLAPC